MYRIFILSLLLSTSLFAAPEIEIEEVQHWAVPNERLASTSMIVVDGIIYSFGGHLGNQHEYAPENFTNESWSLDTRDSSSTWQSLPAKPFALLGQGIAEWNGHIYLFGGFGVKDEQYKEYVRRRKSGDKSARFSMTWLSNNLVEKYDIAKQSWEVLDTNFPIRSSFGFAQLGSKVYIFGGWNSATNEFYDSVGIFDLETETYEDTEIRSPFISRRAFSAYSWGLDKVVIAGGLIPAPGYEPDVNVTDEVWVFHINDKVNPWKELAPMPFTSTIPNLVIFGDYFYLIGGYRGDIGNRGLHPDNEPMNTDQVYVYENGKSEYKLVDGLRSAEAISFRRMIQLNDHEWAAIGGYKHIEGHTDGIMKSRPGQIPSSIFEIIRMKNKE